MAFLFDFYRVLRFSTRLPLPELEAERADPIVPAKGFAASFGLVGIFVGCIGAGVLLASEAIGVPSMVSASLAVAAMVLLTGALHEDGLADCADGFGGGRTIERKLEIMRDPTVGAYGVVSLVIIVVSRIAIIAALVNIDVVLAAGALAASQGLSRSLTMLVAARLPNAREDGASAALGDPPLGFARLGLGLTLLAAWAVLTLATDPAAALRLVAAITLSGAFATLIFTRVAKEQIGGKTGDVLGANQQLADVCGLVLLVPLMNHYI
ncbi:MAG: adenosylcobinamide-GDP ribazoletransferase [Pseudomonadota bacterium]